MKICFIQTGGTIDKIYPQKPGAWGFEIGQAAAEKITQYLGSAIQTSFFGVCKKDSQEITNADREQLVRTINECDSKHIIVTHGTDTMLLTSLYLIGKCPDKTVVITGSQTPWKMKESDAEFNLGMSVSAVQTLTSGVYICIQGLVLKAGESFRDPITGQFHKRTNK